MLLICSMSFSWFDCLGFAIVCMFASTGFGVWVDSLKGCFCLLACFLLVKCCYLGVAFGFPVLCVV